MSVYQISDISKTKMKNRGFTLVELLVVISIIGILTVIGVVSFSGAQKKARDIARKTELSALSKALMMYYSDKGVFPATISFGSEFNDGVYIYMKKTPSETRNTLPGFCYILSSDQKSFGLFTGLENSSDPDCVGAGYNLLGSCASARTYCYATVSPNVLATEIVDLGLGTTMVHQSDPI